MKHAFLPLLLIMLTIAPILPAKAQNVTVSIKLSPEQMKSWAESGNAQAQKLPIFKKNGESEEQVNKIPLRMITVLTDNVLNNDIMDDLISTVNNKNLEACR